MGRPRKTIEQLERDGTLRDDRHAPRRRAPAYDGAPVMPKNLSNEARQLWAAIVPQLVERGVAKGIDAPALEQLCYWWGRLQQLKRKRVDTREHDLRIAKAQDLWNTLAAKFGLTPADRARLEIPEGQDPSNPFEAFLKRQLSRN